ncbi:MAG: hypothetical protein BWX86_02579 [Verrucomicrobia bacterium ADurb.Bin122]|nr:MAG: hypothetical protein BWX86_02579 [Verrucomicrobia bacterium ADurb.Bin122]
MGAAVEGLFEVLDLAALGTRFGEDGVEVPEGDADGLHDFLGGLLDRVGHVEKHTLILGVDACRLHAQAHHEDTQGDVIMGEMALGCLGVLQAHLDLEHLLLLGEGDTHARVHEVDGAFVELVGGVGGTLLVVALHDEVEGGALFAQFGELCIEAGEFDGEGCELLVGLVSESEEGLLVAGDGGLQLADAAIAHPGRSPGFQRCVPAGPVAAPANLACESKGVWRQVHGRGLIRAAGGVGPVRGGPRAGRV